MSRVLYIQYTNPAGYPPLQHGSRILADAGWQVLFLGTGAAGAGALAFPLHQNITVRRMDFCKPGWHQKLHYVRFCLWVLWTVLVWRPRWIYASDQLSCPAALLPALMPGTKMLYHEHDSPQSAPASGRFSAFVARSRRILARRADLCVLPNEVRLERFRSSLGPLRDSVCVWNCPAISEVVPPRGPATNLVRVLYHGSIVPDRLPPAVVQALTLLPENVHLRVAGYETVGSQGYVAQLLRQAQELNVAHRIEFLGSIPQRSALLAWTLGSDIGLALMPMESSDWNCETMTGASNKAFDYLACGLSLIVSDLSDWRRMFADPGYARVCDPRDAGSIAAAVREWITNPAVMRQAGELGRQQILAGWNYETVFQPVLRHMFGTPQSVASPARLPGESAAQPSQK